MNDIQYKYLAFKGGRLCNLLYYVLQTYLRNKTSREFKYKYLCGSESNRKQLSFLGLSDIVHFPSNVAYESIRGKHQRVNSDFTISDANALISEYILKAPGVSEIVNESYDLEDAVAIHIRNGDYYSHGNKFVCFDRIDYIRKAIERVNSHERRYLYVFSDDIDLCRANYDRILTNSFSSVFYNPTGPAEQDLIRLACFSSKILFNSTFSVWSGFIGNVLYPGTEKNVIAPGICWSTDRSTNIYNPSWNIVDIKTVV